MATAHSTLFFIFDDPTHAELWPAVELATKKAMKNLKVPSSSASDGATATNFTDILVPGCTYDTQNLWKKRKWEKVFLFFLMQESVEKEKKM